MSDWNTYLTEDTLNWLLEDSNPSVRYFTLKNILGMSENENELIEARIRIMEKPPISKILSKQNPDGSFLTDAMKKRCTQIAPESGYQPKYRGSIWQAIFLAQLGAGPNDERVRRLGEFILDTNYLKDRGVIGLWGTFRGGGGATIPCYVGNMIWSLSKLGFYNNERIRNSIKWLLKYQRFDDGNFKTPNEWPYRGRQDRCFGKHSCYIGCTQALKAMTVIPESDRTDEIEKFIKRGIEFILLHKVYKRSRGTCRRGETGEKGRPIRKEYELLTFPLTYYDDIIEILETLLFFKIKDKAIDDTIDFILEKRNENGRWNLEKTVRRSAMFSKLEDKRQESKWITYRVLNVLKKY